MLPKCRWGLFNFLALIVLMFICSLGINYFIQLSNYFIRQIVVDIFLFCFEKLSTNTYSIPFKSLYGFSFDYSKV